MHHSFTEWKCNVGQLGGSLHCVSFESLQTIVAHILIVFFMIDAYEINHMWTADMKSNEEWSSQLWSQFLQLRKEAWKKIQDFNGAWTRDLAIPSHRYREVTGSSPVEVLNFFFQASLRNCKNCDHNCEDHSSFEVFFIVTCFLPVILGWRWNKFCFSFCWCTSWCSWRTSKNGIKMQAVSFIYLLRLSGSTFFHFIIF